MDEDTLKPIRLRPITTAISLFPFWPGRAEIWFLYVEAEFRQYGITDSLAKFLAVMLAPPRDLTTCVSMSMLCAEVSTAYELLKAAIPKTNDLSDRQRPDEPFRNIELGHGSAVQMLARMRKAVGNRNFDEELSRELFLSKLPQSVQAVLVTLHGAIDDSAASADRILEISWKPALDNCTLEAQPSSCNSEITDLCNTLRQLLSLESSRTSPKPRLNSYRHSTARSRSKSKPCSPSNPHWC